MSTAGIPSTVQEAPLAARLVYAVLEAAGGLGRDDLVDRTGLARRTIQDALTDLRQRNLVESKRSPRDGRRLLYFIAEDAPSTGFAPTRDPSRQRVTPQRNER